MNTTIFDERIQLKAGIARQDAGVSEFNIEARTSL
jgi:hypothetical protein